MNTSSYGGDYWLPQQSFDNSTESLQVDCRIDSEWPLQHEPQSLLNRFPLASNNHINAQQSLLTIASHMSTPHNNISSPQVNDLLLNRQQTFRGYSLFATEQQETTRMGGMDEPMLLSLPSPIGSNSSRWSPCATNFGMSNVACLTPPHSSPAGVSSLSPVESSSQLRSLTTRKIMTDDFFANYSPLSPASSTVSLTQPTTTTSVVAAASAMLRHGNESWQAELLRLDALRQQQQQQQSQQQQEPMQQQPLTPLHQRGAPTQRRDSRSGHRLPLRSATNLNADVMQQILDCDNNELENVDKWCTFCQKSGEPENIYKSHRLRDSLSRLTCPVLAAYTCEHCGQTGQQAHTKSHCPALLRAAKLEKIYEALGAEAAEVLRVGKKDC